MLLMTHHLSTQLGSPPILWEAKNWTSPDLNKALLGRHCSYELHQTDFLIVSFCAQDIFTLLGAVVE